MEEKNVKLGCCIGMLVGMIVSLMLAPTLWWLGIIAGACAGYVFYDLKEVRQKAPIALKTVTDKGFALLKKTLAYCKEPHPFGLLYLIMFVLLFLLFKTYLLASNIHFVLYSAVIAYLSFLLTIALLTLASTGSLKHKFGEDCNWGNGTHDGWGANKIEPTYRNIYRLALKGLWIIIYSIFWQLWVILIKFIWTLIKLIHSKGRVICGIDSALGTAVIYWISNPSWIKKEPADFIFLGFCSLIIGWSVGIVHYKIITMIKSRFPAKTCSI